MALGGRNLRVCTVQIPEEKLSEREHPARVIEVLRDSPFNWDALGV